MNTSDSVNTQPLSPVALEKALAVKLQGLLTGIPWLPEVRVDLNPADFNRIFDLSARFHVPDGPVIELWVDVKRDPRPAHFPYVNLEREFEEKKVRRVRVRVFAAPHISPRMAEICENHGWSWFDLAGNCRISVPGLLHLQHTGNPPLQKRPRPKATLKTKEAGRVVRALLSPVFFGLPWTQRSLQIRCQPEVSLGLVNKMAQYLLKESFIEQLPDGGFHLSDPLKLLYAWRDAYRFDQHERQGYFSPLQGTKLREALMELDDDGEGWAVYSAFSAADFQAPHVRQPKTWLYVSSRELENFKHVVEAKLVDSGENLVVLVPSDDGVFYQREIPRLDDHLAVTNPLQTYVDLWYCGGRGKEAAEAVLEQVLKPIWRAGGYEV